MRRLHSILLFALTIPLMGYWNDNNDLEIKKYQNFIAAIKNHSTFGYFTVIKVKNLNTGVTKEICSKGNFVSGALHMELGAEFDSKGERIVLDFARTKRDRYFEFKNKKALNNISFLEYEPNQLPKIQQKYNLDKVAEKIKKDKKFAIRLNESEMKLFAHLLFEKGLLTGESDCFGGALEYVDEIKHNE